MSKRRSFALREGTLLIFEGDAELGRLRPGEAPVHAFAVDAPGGSVYVVTDPGSGSLRVANLYKIDPAGRVLWRVEPPGSEPADAFVAISVTKDGIPIAATWSGYKVMLDPDTGQATSLKFV